MSNIKNNVFLVFIILAFVMFLLGISPAESGENQSVQVKTSRRHSRILANNDAAGKGMVIGIDARHLLRLMEMDPNLYVLYIGSGSEFERRFGGSRKAMHIALKQIKENTLQFPKNRTLVLVCPSGQQSAVAAKILSARGYVVYYVIGGMKALNKYEHYKSPPVKKEHKLNNKKTPIRKKNDGLNNPPEFTIEEDMGC